MKVIKVENLSKAYRIGLKEQKSDTLGGAIVNLVKKPLNNFKRLRSLSSISEKSNEEDVFWALKDINFEVEEGEILGIIGKNGAGKSTLLKILSRITEPTTGKIEINGRVASLLEVGTGFNPELTGRENTYLNGTILGMTKKEIDKKFDEIVDFSGVEKFIDTPVKRYSSGMRVRLAFAVAAFLEPEILIIDEVLAVGDAEFQKKCLGKMQDISSGEGRTVLFVSHNMAAVQTLCNKGLVLKKGIVSYFGSSIEAIKKYLHQYLNEKRFIKFDFDKAPSSNFLKLIFVGVKNVTGNYDDVIREGEPVEINFEFEIYDKFQNHLDITFHLYDELGILVFVGGTGLNEETKGKFGKDNHNKAVCFIPENLLIQGSYSIQRLLIVKDSGNVIFSIDDIVQFEVIPRVSSEFGWMGKKEGAVKPKLNWKLFK